MGDGIITQVIKVQDIAGFSGASARDRAKERRLSNLAADHDILRHIYLPVCVKGADGTYQLIGRKWVYAYLVSSGTTEFPSIIVSDNLADEIIQLDHTEIALLSAYGLAGTHIPGRSRATETRHKARRAGQICPICQGPLRSVRANRRTVNATHKISCENKSRRDIMCPFEAMLTDYEYAMFTRYELPTSMWLTVLDGEKCPDCGESMYMRLVHTGEAAEVKTVKRCKSKYSGLNSCGKKAT